ncbi:cell surface ecto-5'-nucleotidase Nt5e [Streptococcus saliviloxodontae]|uniref:5'-nucleotidase n=1 Tax=Streptococcus saliviloxodontae TaxID=1349416 RepID=A0ABS2PKP0_9STRE|nr:cell surface ecto-5'-nucleotidase Nt5e [Streptococcus saliviloxodontae]MBM7636000.1 5'-nucleotidase [Streptococcus saliviloxodontae]
MKKKALLIPALSTVFLSTLVLANAVKAEDATTTETTSDATTVLALTDSQTSEVSEDTSVATDAVATETAVVTDAADETFATTTEETPVEPATTAVGDTTEESTPSSDEITIIHTNDVHGRMQESSGVIGDAKLATIVNEARQEGETVVLDAGDVFQGLPISNSSKGEDMAEILNTIGYDAMTLGNHEFDFGLEQLKNLSTQLNFPMVSSNVYVDGARLFQAYTIVDKNKKVKGDELVVIGVTTPETATKTHPSNVEHVTFTDPVTEVNSVISQVEAQAAAEGNEYKTYVILAHLGVDTTTPTEWQGTYLAEALSKNELLKGKKLILIDGHSHTVLSGTYGDFTYNQTGSYLNNVGIIKLNSKEVLSAGVISAKEAEAITPDPTVAALVKETEDKYNADNAVVVVSESPVELNGDRTNVRVRETNLGNVVADALLDYGQTGFSHKTNLAVTNGGGLRETIKKGAPITKGDLIAVLPFGNVISQIKVTGQNIQDMFVKSVGSILQKDSEGQYVLDENGQPLMEPSGGYLHIAGARVYYDTSLESDKRILEIDILDPETQTYKPLDLTAEYYLTTNDFLAAGGDGYTMLGGSREEGPSMDVVFADYLTSHADELSSYAVINPNSRAISISQAAYEALKSDTTTSDDTKDTDKASTQDGKTDKGSDTAKSNRDSSVMTPDTDKTSTQDSKNGKDSSEPKDSTVTDKNEATAVKTNEPVKSGGWTSTSYLAPVYVQPATVQESRSNTVSVPVTYKTSHKTQPETSLPNTASQESLFAVMAGLALIGYGMYGVRRKKY